MPSASGPKSDSAPLGDPDAELLSAIVSLLHKHREEKNLTLRDLEKSMKISHSYLSKVERGLAIPGLIVLMRWCRALDLQFVEVWKQASEMD